MKILRLTRGKATTYDDTDHAIVARHKWYVQRTVTPAKTKWYAATKTDGREVSMHRLLTGALPGQSVDHINGNGLDNRRANLRIATHGENMRNRMPSNQRYEAGFITSRHKGVYRSRPCPACQGAGGDCEKCHGTGGRWRACISVKGRTRALGTFNTEEEAARAYDTAAQLAWGSWAKPNFPQERGDYNE